MRYRTGVTNGAAPLLLACYVTLALVACEVDVGKDAFPSGAGNGGPEAGLGQGGGGSTTSGFGWAGAGGVQAGFGQAGGGGIQAGFPTPEPGASGSNRPIGAVCTSNGDCASGLCRHVGSPLESDQIKELESYGIPNKPFDVCTLACTLGEDEGEMGQGSCPTGSICMTMDEGDAAYCLPACNGEDDDCNACKDINPYLSCDSDVCRCYSDVCIEGFDQTDESGDCGSSGGHSSAYPY